MLFNKQKRGIKPRYGVNKGSNVSKESMANGSMSLVRNYQWEVLCAFVVYVWEELKVIWWFHPSLSDNVHPKLNGYAMLWTYILWTLISTCIYSDSSINNYAPIDDAAWFHVMLHKHKKRTKNPKRASSKMNKQKKHDISIKLSPHLSQCSKGFEEAY